MPPEQDDGMDFLSAGVDEVAAGLDTGAGGADPAAGTGSSPSPDQQAASSSGAGVPAPAGAAPSNPWDTAPKSWKQDYHSHWGALNPDVRKYIHEREKQALDGLMQYKTQVDNWNQTLSPFQQWIEHYGVQPNEVVQRMLNAHLTLLHGPADKKLEFARAMLKDYGLEQLLSQQPGAQGSPPPDATAAVQQLLQPIAQKVQQLEQMTVGEQRAQLTKQVDAFLADPKNEFANELIPDMVKLIDRGLASDLQSAYDQACRLNETVAQKIIQRQIEAATKPARPGQRNVTSSPVPPAPTATAARSIEEDMSDFYDQIVNR